MSLILGLAPQALCLRPLRGLKRFMSLILGLAPQALCLRPLRGLVSNSSAFNLRSRCQHKAWSASPRKAKIRKIISPRSGRQPSLLFLVVVVIVDDRKVLQFFRCVTFMLDRTV